MTDFFETTIKNFSGLSSETKPTTAAGNDVPNGSRWREVDTDKNYFYNLSNDTWYEINEIVTLADGTKVIITDGTNDAVVDASGQLHVILDGTVDANNTTTTPLGIAGVYTGTATEILGYATIAILVGSDEAGTLTIQYSPDGSDWHDGESYAILAGANKFFTPPTQSAYYRVVYTNGGVEQLSFYLHPVLKKIPIKWSSHNIDDPIVDQDDAELVKAVITGKKTSGDYDNVSLTNGANMKVSLEELESGISSNSNSQLNTTPFESGGGEYKQDLSTGAFTTISYAHHEIHSGSHFFTGNYTILGNGATYDILFVTPDSLEYAHMIFELATEAESMFSYYEATTASANGTPLVMFDRNRITDNTPSVTFYHTPTVTNVGTELGAGIFGSGKTQGGSLRDSNEIMMKPNTKYLMRVTNNTTSNNWYDWQFDWYEHTNRS